MKTGARATRYITGFMACVGLAYVTPGRPSSCSSNRPDPLPDHTIGGEGGAGNARRLTIYGLWAEGLVWDFSKLSLGLYLVREQQP